MLTKTENNPLTKDSRQQQDEAICQHKTVPTQLRGGVLCPRCTAARLDYNGLLQLMCPRCGVLETGTFT